MKDFEKVNSEKAFNNVRNGIWDLKTFHGWLNFRETEARNDALVEGRVEGHFEARYYANF